MTQEEKEKAKEQAKRWTSKAAPSATKPREPRTTGPRGLPIGVYPSGVPAKPFRARIRVDSKVNDLGHFATAELAGAAITEWKKGNNQHKPK